jgi:hypothetical protein
LDVWGPSGTEGCLAAYYVFLPTLSNRILA